MGGNYYPTSNGGYAAGVVTMSVDGNGLASPSASASAGAASYPANIASNQVSVGNTATLIVGARAGRSSVTIVQEGTTLVRLGASGVTTVTGVPLPGVQYASFAIDGGAAVYGIVASGTQTVSFIETY